MSYLRDFLCCFGATFAFCILMRAPRRAVLFTSAMAACSWMLYDLVGRLTGADLAAYFCASLFVASLSEVGARRLRMPAIIFLFPALIPYVPGVGIYETMRHMVEGALLPFLESGVHTLLIAGSIAAAVALVNIFFSCAPVRKFAARRGRTAPPS